RALASRRLQEADSGETSEHRQTQKSRRLPLCKVGRAIDEITEASIADLVGGLVDIFGRRIDATGCERHVVFECACRIPDVAGEAADEIGARALLLASLILEAIRSSGRSFLGGLGRFLEFVACGVRRRPQHIAGALFDLSAGVRHLVLQVLGRAGILVLGKILIAGVEIHIAHGGLYSAVGFREGSKAVVTTSSATSLSRPVTPSVMRLACPPRSASETLLAAASAADSTVSLAASNPDWAALPAARLTRSLALPMTLASALVLGREAARIAPIARPRLPINTALSRITLLAVAGAAVAASFAVERTRSICSLAISEAASMPDLTLSTTASAACVARSLRSPAIPLAASAIP